MNNEIFQSKHRNHFLSRKKVWKPDIGPARKNRLISGVCNVACVTVSSAAASHDRGRLQVHRVTFKILLKKKE